MHTRLVPIFAASLVVAMAAPALAATYQVGPSRSYQNFGSLPPLEPGDVVEVDGGATYPSVSFWKSGTAQQPIVLRGIRVNGQRPVISGGVNTVAFNAHHFRMEGFEVTGGSSRCVFHHGNDIVIRDSVVRDCPGHGILGADNGSGSLTLQYVEVYGCGEGDRKHQIYMSTDQELFPGSVFRMEHSYVHSGNGGNNVKSRAERNEIYYNWIEGAYYHEIELIGPEVFPEGYAREDSDIVGNVIRKTGSNSSFYAIRIGGDGTASTWGRYRFVNNTVLMASDQRAVFRLFDGIESVEMHNNIFHATGGAQIIKDLASWSNGVQTIGGSNNWISTGSWSVPSQWSATAAGSSAGFVDLGALDLRPTPGSALCDAAVSNPPGMPGHLVADALGEPLYHPPGAVLPAVDAAEERPISGGLDIGAFEYLAAPGEEPPGEEPPGEEPPDDDPTDPYLPPSGDPLAGVGSGVSPDTVNESYRAGCSAAGGAAGWGVLLLAAGLLLVRRSEPAPVRSRARRR